MHAWDVKHEKPSEEIPCCQPVGCIKSNQGKGLAEKQHFQDMLFLPMSCFLGQDANYLIICMVGQQGVKQDNSFHVADTGKISITVAGPLGGIHGEHPVYLQANSGHDLL